MPRGSVSFTLDDGETLSLPEEDLRGIYEALWGLAKEPGAVFTAALLMDAWRLHPVVRKPIALTTPQSTVMRDAVALLNAERSKAMLACVQAPFALLDRQPLTRGRNLFAGSRHPASLRVPVPFDEMVPLVADYVGCATNAKVPRSMRPSTVGTFPLVRVGFGALAGRLVGGTLVPT